MSEVNMLRTIIHYKRFELLTHPLCELFLHLKWKRAHGLYYLVKVLHIFFTLLIMAYVLIFHGEFKYGMIGSDAFWRCHNSSKINDSSLELETESRLCWSASSILPILIAVISVILGMIHVTKFFQNAHRIIIFFRVASK